MRSVEIWLDLEAARLLSQYPSFVSSRLFLPPPPSRLPSARCRPPKRSRKEPSRSSCAPSRVRRHALDRSPRWNGRGAPVVEGTPPAPISAQVLLPVCLPFVCSPTRSGAGASQGSEGGIQAGAPPRDWPGGAYKRTPSSRGCCSRGIFSFSRLIQSCVRGQSVLRSLIVRHGAARCHDLGRKAGVGLARSSAGTVVSIRLSPANPFFCRLVFP